MVIVKKAMFKYPTIPKKMSLHYLVKCECQKTVGNKKYVL